MKRRGEQNNIRHDNVDDKLKCNLKMEWEWVPMIEVASLNAMHSYFHGPL